MARNYKFGKTSIEREKAFENIKYLFEEKKYSLDDIGKMYDASKQAVNQFLVNRGYIPSEQKYISRARFRKKLEGTFLEEKFKSLEKRYNSYRFQTSFYKKQARQRKEIIVRIINNFNNFLKDQDLLAFSLMMKSILKDFENMESKKKEEATNE